MLEPEQPCKLKIVSVTCSIVTWFMSAIEPDVPEHVSNGGRSCVKTVDDIDLTPGDRQAIETASRLVRERFPVVQVILFGSKARGNSDAESDIDLLLLTSRPLDWRERDAITDALFDLELQFDVVISTLVLPTDEWEQGPYLVLPIGDEIRRDGVQA